MKLKSFVATGTVGLLAIIGAVQAVRWACSWLAVALTCWGGWGIAEAAHAALIGRGDLDQGRVERELAGGEQARDVGQENRGVVAQAFLNDGAHVFGDKEAVDREVLRQLLVGVGGFAEGEQVDELDVASTLTVR